MSEKIKDKIEKLLNLSMSDNEHEAKLALERALKLMNEHNITKDEVYRQNFVSKEFDMNYKRLPDWVVTLYDLMTTVSGCKFTWKRNYMNSDYVQRGRITGRERDVENAQYLISFLLREIDKKSAVYKKEIQEVYTTKYLRILMKSYKKGIVESVFARLMEQHKVFFNEQAKGTDLVCVDLETKLKDAKAFLEELLDNKPKTHTSKAQYEKRGIKDGMNDGEKIELNQAVSKQDEVRQIGVKNERHI
ncbi:DUF2786 domain-containing protein [Arcobacter roscoffensis]|uniref:DUF2786 domain-containing protein n=1 Tax=Arcobacter roscoffensis TaxID=2961520 RepID=A0ABY5DZN7_9BACT|nr:DUF2786 domain-containing protein [Arcobacter roscoffensis]UTJ05416.1 DUF2786 domain-containing protein [Arcobacter roscoffensis]